MRSSLPHSTPWIAALVAFAPLCFVITTGAAGEHVLQNARVKDLLSRQEKTAVIGVD